MLAITKANFNAEVPLSDKPVPQDCRATWCRPCRMFAPTLAQFAEKHPEIKVGKMEADKEPAPAMEHRILSIPSLFLYRNGRAEKTAVGAMQPIALKKRVK